MIFFKYNMKAVKTNELTSPLMEIIGSLAFATVILVGGSKVISGELTTGTFTSFIAALFMLLGFFYKVSATLFFLSFTYRALTFKEHTF